ncbi:hypothetical protein [Paraburkholderia panacisoli]|nr:hypothetical protein [Paraburkholderia panacisoli]
MYQQRTQVPDGDRQNPIRISRADLRDINGCLTSFAALQGLKLEMAAHG